ncbi:MAG: hypothetical protein LBB59_01005 [Campylobacteraceae bacterium]|jgi:hypothetical protein|nr:hypothetical protein [Campylobacteraceae bacterium]
MNDMFDNLKELKQKLKLPEASKQNAKKPRQNEAIAKIEDKESRLRAEFKEFMKEADI